MNELQFASKTTIPSDPQDITNIAVSMEGDTPTVSGRDLHARLGVKTAYKDWFPRMVEYGFCEGEDFAVLPAQKRATNNPKNPWTEITDHEITLDMAKQICMIQRTEIGKTFREYFLEVERKWNSPEAVMARALRMANANLAKITGENNDLREKNQALLLDNTRLAVENQINAPKAEYFDELVDRNLLTNFRDTAAELHIPQKKFIAELLRMKYIYRDNKGKLKPYAEKNEGLFETKETVNTKTGFACTQTLITPKGRETFRLLMQGLVEGKEKENV